MEATALTMVADPVLIYDQRGKLIDYNPAAGRLFGHELQRANIKRPIGKRRGIVIMRELNGHLLPRHRWPPMRALRGETFTGDDAVDVRFRSAERGDVYLSISGAPLTDATEHITGAVCVARDVTERYHTEQALADRASQLDSIFATQVDGVLLTDAAGRPVRMNAAHLRLQEILWLGETSQGARDDISDLERQGLADRWGMTDIGGHRIPPDQLPVARALRGETLIGEQTVELRSVADNGDLRIFQISGAPVRNASGAVIGAVLTTRDISNQRRSEAKRLEVMRLITHDLSSPITALDLYVQIQQRRQLQGQELTPPDDELLRQMSYTLGRAKLLLDDLRIATSIEMGTLKQQRTRHDLRDLCRDAVTSEQMASGRQIVYEWSDEPVWADVDHHRIGQVVANLLTNAVKYSPPGRSIEVTLRGESEQAIITVRDEGAGIPLEEQRDLFTEYYRARSVHTLDGSTGLGLGLFICKQIVDQHGGEIGVESSPGSGSTFWFRLPLASAPHDDATPTETVDGLWRERHERVGAKVDLDVSTG